MTGQRTVLLPLCIVTIAALLMASAVPATQQPAVAHPASQQEFWAQFDKADWEGAVAAAERLVAEERGRSGVQPTQLADALNLLGSAQLKKGDYSGAEASFTESLTTLERSVGRTNGSLVEPLRGIGYTLAAAGRHQEALPHLERALLVAHHSFGLFDMGQQGILVALATSLTLTGQPNEAQRHMQYLLRAAQSTYGARDPRTAPVLCVIGDWYADLGVFSTARAYFREAIDVVQRKLGKNDPALIEPLRALARSYTQELYLATRGTRVSADSDATDARANAKVLANDGERALEQALQILEQSPASAHDSLGATLVQLGDWYQTKQLPDKALPHYRRAWTTIAALEQSADGTVKAFNVPAMLYYPTPLLATRNQRAPATQIDIFFVQVEFTVAPDGTVKDARAVESDATQRQVADTLGAIRAARFRPKFVNGEPVETTSVTYRETFRIRKQPAAEKTTASAAS
jgi:TonB family protein